MSIIICFFFPYCSWITSLYFWSLWDYCLLFILTCLSNCCNLAFDFSICYESITYCIYWFLWNNKLESFIKERWFINEWILVIYCSFVELFVVWEMIIYWGNVNVQDIETGKEGMVVDDDTFPKFTISLSFNILFLWELF